MAGDLIAGRYELEELVGTGGMSSVYKAYDRRLERNVALKVLHERLGADDEHVSRFRHEARAVAQLSHPNIVAVIDRGEDGGRRFIVFEYIDGETLRQLVDRAGGLPVRRAVEITVAVADGLAYAHERGVVHRDVKPQNILLSRDGEVKVTDFGIARSLDAESGLTLTGTVLGTSSYLSPEQASGLHVTPAADVYSLGVVLYELLAGEVPFPGGNQVVVALKQMNEPPPSLLERRPDVPVRLVRAVARALEREPERRFASMSDFATELRSCLDEVAPVDTEQTMIAPPPAAPPSTQVTRERRRRTPLVVALLGLAVVAAVVVAVVLSARHDGPPAAAGTGGGGVTVRGVTAYDPEGTGTPGEDNADAPKATDGNPVTFWSTEIYKTPAFGNLKSGVGLVLDAGSAVKLGSLTVTTDTPGYTAKILAGGSSSGPFGDDSSSQTVGASTTFRLNGTTARYYVVWITELPPGDVAHVNEATAG